MKRCAFLTLDDPTGFVMDDDLAFEPLARLGWQVEAVPWRQLGQPWQAFDAVVIRSPWDYHRSSDSFFSVLAEIARSGTRLFNSLELVAWNLRKTYLRELEDRGVGIVPTIWRAQLGSGQLEQLAAAIGGPEIVVKPIVGAGAEGAFRLRTDRLRERAHEVETHFSSTPLMAQPLVRSVLTEGEYSLFYFNRELSHAILKTPKAMDFRVQEEHGGHIRPVAASEALRRAGQTCLDALDETPLYARVDLVRSNEDYNSFWLMELELIEPSLYLRMDPKAPEHFARALEERFQQEN